MISFSFRHIVIYLQYLTHIYKLFHHIDLKSVSKKCQRGPELPSGQGQAPVGDGRGLRVCNPPVIPVIPPNKSNSNHPRSHQIYVTFL